MIYYKTAEEIEQIRDSCLLVSKVLTHVATRIRPGITGTQLDKEAEELIRDHRAKPAFKGYRGFPYTLCWSFNEVVVHGFPNDRELQEGDIISVDCGVINQAGFVGDAAYTFAIGPIEPENARLLRITRSSLYKGIEQAQIGKRLGDISFGVQHFVEQNGFSVVRELVGHGVGKALHEEPEVPNYGRRGQGIVLREGLVIAIEPMVNRGKRDVRTAKDGWTVYAKDRLPAAHFEHTIAVRKDGPDILSNHQPVEQAILQNPSLQSVVGETATA